MRRVYDRIITKNLVNDQNPNGTSELPLIVVDFPEEETKVKEGAANVDNAEGDEQWIECNSDSSNKPDFEYTYEEDPENTTLKKLKRPKNRGGNRLAQFMNFKGPFQYREEVVHLSLINSGPGTAETD